MQLMYTPAESLVKPPEIEVGITTVYFRRAFKQVERLTRMDIEEPELIWTYEEAAVNKDQALQYLVEENGNLAKAGADNDEIAMDHEYRLLMLELGLSET